MPQELLGSMDRFDIFLIRCQGLHQLLQDPDIGLAQFSPFREDPIIIAAGQQIPAVGFGCFLKRIQVCLNIT
jgi:hypothetical protein